MRKTIFTTALLILTIVFTNAQITVSAPDVSGKNGETVEVQIFMDGFNDLVAMYFSLKWDDSIISFSEAKDFNVPNLGQGHLQMRGDSMITLLWDDVYLEGVTVDPNVPLFTIVYDILGQPDEMSLVQFVDPPAIGATMEVVQMDNDDFVEVSLTSDDGSVTVGLISSNDPELTFSAFAVAPNPVRDFVQVTFELDQSEMISLEIHNELGQLAHREIAVFGAGTQTATVETADWGAAGLYFLTLKGDGKQVSRKIILME